MVFRERLSVPLSWWLLAGLATVAMLAAVGLYLGPVWGVAVAGATLLLAATWFTSLAIVISVDADELRVGRAVIERTYLAGASGLDAEQTQHRSGPGADARAHLVLRPYVPTAVEITLSDAADPVPYWLVATRRPYALAAALDDARVSPR